MSTVNKSCPCCGKEDLLAFFSVPDVPVNSCITLESAEDAVNYRCGNINLVFCRSCQFIFNDTFEQDIVEYSLRYQDQQAFSGTFNKFMDDLTDRIIRNFRLDNGLVLEIGSGKCDFLKLLCDKSGSNGIGIDPASPCNNNPGNIEIINEWFSEKHSRYTPDIICCRHTLEHIGDVSGFIQLLKGNILKPDTGIFFEVPNTQNLIDNLAFEDIYYEHCSYFNHSSLKYLFETNGFRVDAIETAYYGQYLLVYAVPENTLQDTNLSKSPDKITETQINGFTRKIKAKAHYWKQLIQNLQKKNEKIVIWGSGSKCVSFIKITGIDTVNINIIDINPLKHGTYSPGVDVPVMLPESISGRHISTVIVMNPVYENEIRKNIGELGIQTNRILPLH